MAEVVGRKSITGQNIVSSSTVLDFYVTETSDDYGTVLGVSSSGIPIEELELKGRVFSGVAATWVSGALGIWASTATVPPFEWLEQENAQLRNENHILREKIRIIEERVAVIEAEIAQERVVILRELSREEAEKEILELFHDGQTLYYSDIAEKLRLDLKLVVEICNELQSRGEIQVVDDLLHRG